MKLSPLVRAALGVLLLGSAGIAVAGGWGATTTITGYYVRASSSAVITTSNNQNPDSRSSSRYLIVDQTQINVASIWATVMTAQATGQTVSLSYNGCSGAYPLINAVAVPEVW